MNRRVLGVGLLIVVPLLIFLALGFGHNPQAIDSPLVGKPAPNFSLSDLDGNQVALEDLAGRPVVLNFWATWCQPCIAEHPLLLFEAEHYAGRVHFVGVIYQDDPQTIRRFLAGRGAWGSTLRDEDSRTAIAYGVYGAPETFIIDARGTIVDKVTGPVQRQPFEALLESLL